jgi:hypothetical protein
MTTSTPPSPQPTPRICLRCDHVGPAKESGAGSVGIGVAIFAVILGLDGGGNVVAICLGLLGAALAAYRPEVRQCRVCGSSEVIPVTSPRAQRAAAQRQTSG